MMIGSIGRPSRPPSRFFCSISITSNSCSGRSLAVMVPDSECRTPTLIEPCSRSVK